MKKISKTTSTSILLLSTLLGVIKLSSMETNECNSLNISSTDIPLPNQQTYELPNISTSYISPSGNRSPYQSPQGVKRKQPKTLFDDPLQHKKQKLNISIKPDIDLCCVLIKEALKEPLENFSKYVNKNLHSFQTNHLIKFLSLDRTQQLLGALYTLTKTQKKLAEIAQPTAFQKNQQETNKTQIIDMKEKIKNSFQEIFDEKFRDIKDVEKDKALDFLGNFATTLPKKSHIKPFLHHATNRLQEELNKKEIDNLVQRVEISTQLDHLEQYENEPENSGEYRLENDKIEKQVFEDVIEQLKNLCLNNPNFEFNQASLALLYSLSDSNTLTQTKTLRKNFKSILKNQNKEKLRKTYNLLNSPLQEAEIKEPILAAKYMR